MPGQKVRHRGRLLRATGGLLWLTEPRLKCNRAQPCQNCTARHQETVCRFHGGKGVSNVQDTAGEVMRQRIENLEDLVKSLVAERREGSPADKNAFPTPESSNGASEETFSVEGPNAPGAFNAGTGKTVVDGIRSMYLGGDDWYTVLEEVNALSSPCPLVSVLLADQSTDK